VTGREGESSGYRKKSVNANGFAMKMSLYAITIIIIRRNKWVIPIQITSAASLSFCSLFLLDIYFA
jgi:hypothetical protein